MATIYEVSELAGVSLATVSRVMNKNAGVSEKTRKKVLDAMDKLGYRPNAIAQSLASNRSNSIGILVSELGTDFYGTMMSGIETHLRSVEKSAIVTAGHDKEAEEREGIEFLISRRCDGLILHVEAVSDDYLIELSKGPVPFILLNHYIPEIAENCITLDNELGGYLATKMALDNGHKEIAYISGPLWKGDAQHRLSGFKRALTEFGIDFDSGLMYEGDYKEASGTEGMKYFLDSGKKFTTVICANDQMASGAMITAKEAGVELPDDVSFVGFDNITLSRFLYPRLSTVIYPVYEMGLMAAKAVLNLTYKQFNYPIQNLFEPEIKPRDSVKKLN